MVLAGLAMLLLGNVSPSTQYAELWPPLALLGLGVGTALTPLNLAALNAMPVRSHGTVAAILAMLAGLGGTFGVALSGALFEALQTRDTVSAVAARGLKVTDAAARTLDGLMSGTPDATQALARYPAQQHAALRAAVHDGFISAFGGAMELSFGLVIVGIVITFLLIRTQAEKVVLPTPNVTQPFSGLSPRP
jgi:hypothetical protein